MPKYPIESWNSVIPKGNTFPFPMIYIKPDSNFIDYAKENSWQVLVTIENTESIYDNKQYYAVIDSSGYFPNYRPYFYNKEGFMTLTILSYWDGYPKNNGNVIIQGLKGPDKLTIKPPAPYEAPKPLPWLFPWEEMYGDSKKTKKTGLTDTQITILFLSILIIFCGLMYMSSKKNKM